MYLLCTPRSPRHSQRRIQQRSLRSCCRENSLSIRYGRSAGYCSSLEKINDVQELTLKPEYQTHAEKVFAACDEHINCNDYDVRKLAETSNNQLWMYLLIDNWLYSQDVNSFVNAHTGGMIPQLVTADACIDEVAVLINDIYLKVRSLIIHL